MITEQRCAEVSRMLAINVSELDCPGRQLVDEHNAAVQRNQAALHEALNRDDLSLEVVREIKSTKLLKIRDDQHAAIFELLKSCCQLAESRFTLMDQIAKELTSLETSSQKALDTALAQIKKGFEKLGVNAETTRGGQQGLDFQIRQTPAVKAAQAMLDDTRSGLRNVSALKSHCDEVQHAVDLDLMAFVKQMIS